VKPGRNDPCPCGSGKKYKKCCGQQAEESHRARDPQAVHASDSVRASAAAPDLNALFTQLKMGRYAELEVSAHGLIRQHRDSGILWKLLGAARFMQGQDAVPALQAAVRLLPTDPESHTNLGNGLRAHARLEEAAACHRRAIELKPDYADAHNNLGSVLRDLGRAQDALASYRKALAFKPDFAMAHNNLGSVLQHLGRLNEAVASYRRAIVMKPGYVEAHNNLGNVLRDLGQTAAAAQSYGEAIELQPDTAELHNNLGNALLDLGRIEDAVQCYRRALELKPDYARAHSNLGSALRDLWRLDEAEMSYERALAIQPDSGAILTNLAVLQRLQGYTAQAEASLRRALELDAASAATLTSLGDVHADRGQFTEAEVLYRRACAVQGDFAQAWAGIAGLRKMTLSDRDWIAQAQRIAARPMRPREEVHLRYALGKYFDDVKDYEQAFTHYQRANEVAKTYSPAHDRQHLAQTFEFISRLYDRDWVDQAKVRSNASSRPIFVVGMPRSGTSLAEQILASHPQVFGAGELSFWKAASLKVGAAALQAAASDGLAQLANEYLRLLTDLSPEAAHVVDKLPGNFAHLGMIHAALPHARIIHMRRNPLDTCLSIYFQNFHIAHTYANDLDDLAHYYDQYLRLMEHWRSILPQEAILDVPYESLVDDQETWSRKMLDFVGLPWDEACIDFHQTSRRVSTFSKWQVRQRINRSSVERWRNYAPFVGPLLRLESTWEH
jgi:tetratricopeptide (TPR) repeat protein